MRRLLFLLIISLITGVIGSGFFIMNKKETNAVHVYFYYQDRLISVSRQVAPDDNKAKLAIIALLNGPHAEEQTRGLFSLLPKGLQVSEINRQGKTLTVYFSKELLTVSGGYEQINGMIKQIVFTLTDLPGITSVGFRITGHPNAALALGGEGYIISAPLTRDSFIKD
jgi:spore germination protein GerM